MAATSWRWRAALAVLVVSLTLNVLTLVGVVRLAAAHADRVEDLSEEHAAAVEVLGAKIEAMDAIFRRCSVGVRWVERHWDRGRVLAVEREALEQLTKELDHDGPDDPPQR